MLRTLHPQTEAQQYQTAWHGASFRNYDWTPPPGTLPDYSGLNPPETVHRSIAQYVRTRPVSQPMESVYRCLSEVQRSIHELSVLSGLTYFQTRQWLTALVRKGRAVRVGEPTTAKVYRKFRARVLVRYALPRRGAR